MKPRAMHGYALIAMLAALLVVTLAGAVAMHSLVGLSTLHSKRACAAAAFHAAEAGLEKAKWELSRGHLDYAGEQGLELGKATVEVRVQREKAGKRFVAESEAIVVCGSGLQSTCRLRATFVARGGRVVMTGWERVRPGQGAVRLGRE